MVVVVSGGTVVVVVGGRVVVVEVIVVVVEVVLVVVVEIAIVVVVVVVSFAAVAIDPVSGVPTEPTPITLPIMERIHDNGDSTDLSSAETIPVIEIVIKNIREITKIVREFNFGSILQSIKIIRTSGINTFRFCYFQEFRLLTRIQLWV